MTTSARPIPIATIGVTSERSSGLELVLPSDRRRAMIASETYDLAVGDVLAGKFRVERILGEGGMGLVVAATHLGLDERVALKILRPSARKNAEAIARFFQEARAAAKLKSEHVAHVLDVSQREDGSPYIVMEFLRGSDLRQVLTEAGSMSVENVATYMIQACEALAEAHARGIIHRDIKPENLFLTERSQGWSILKILDFGISKAVLRAEETSVSNIRTGAIMGSPSYMSPEQLRETATVDHRTDIWALGAVMYELLTGKPPFDPNMPLTGLVLKIVQDEPASIHSLREHLPVELSSIVARCLAKNREDRFATTADLAIALLPFAPNRARVAAERAVAVTRESGLSAQPLAMPLSTPPRFSSGVAGLAKTALALEIQLPPISTRQIVNTHPQLVGQLARAARARSWADVALGAIFAAAIVAVVAILGLVPAAATFRAFASRTRATSTSHERVMSGKDRHDTLAGDDLLAPKVAAKPMNAAPRPVAAPQAPPLNAPVVIDPTFAIRGSR